VLLQLKEFELFADYHQFYLWDSGMNPLAPTDYSKEDVSRRVKMGTHVFVIQPERDMTVSVAIEIHDAEPPYDPDKWDHIAEGSLHLPTGNLQVHECTGGPVADFQVAKGWYRVRSFHGGLGTVNERGLEGGDRYLAVFWPAPSGDLLIIKQWQGPPGG